MGRFLGLVVALPLLIALVRNFIPCLRRCVDCARELATSRLYMSRICAIGFGIQCSGAIVGLRLLGEAGADMAGIPVGSAGQSA